MSKEKITFKSKKKKKILFFRQELECLSVKQLKEILMVNRVDFKGCCEKQELLERVERLWKDLKATPGLFILVYKILKILNLSSSSSIYSRGEITFG